MLERGPILRPDHYYVLPEHDSVNIDCPRLGQLQAARPGDIRPIFRAVSFLETGHLTVQADQEVDITGLDFYSIRRVRTWTVQDINYYDGIPAFDVTDAQKLSIQTPPTRPDEEPQRLPLAQLTVRSVRSFLQARRKDPPKTAAAAWQPLLGDDMEINWPIVWVWARSEKHRTRYQSDLLWKILLNVLPTGHRFQWTADSDGKCPHGCGALETAPHALFECRFARDAWTASLASFAQRAGMRLSLSAALVALGRPGRPLPRLLRPVWVTWHACTINAIWAARCRMFFDRIVSSPISIVADCIFKFERFVRKPNP